MNFVRFLLASHLNPKEPTKVRAACGNVGSFTAILISRDQRDANSWSVLRDRHDRVVPLARRVAFWKRSLICELCSGGDGSEAKFRGGTG